jgi:hypothetical protein
VDHIAHRKLGDLPGFVRGMSAICTTFAGTWRGDAPERIFWRILSRKASSSVTVSASRTNSTTRTSLSQSCPIATASITSGICSTYQRRIGSRARIV